ncbi:MAG TPA: ABC transporter permease, partial [Chthoniobacterales bacterium]|nr:ABC transporter permease [Chthoniobacterales bacterium]
MFSFVARRVLQMIPVLLAIATLTFFMIRLAPGGPFDAEKNVSPEIRKNLESYYGMNKPVYQQYFDYLGRLVQGDLGPSFKYSNW